MFVHIKRTPVILYHYTTTINADKIIKCGYIKSNIEPHSWFFEDFNIAVDYFNKTKMNPNFQCCDKDGIPRKMGNVNKSDYVIVCFKPSHPNQQNWFKLKIPTKYTNDETVFNPYKNTIAYKGTLYIKNVKLLQIP